MGASGPSGGSGTGPQELGFTTRDKRTAKQKQKDANVEMGLGKDRISNYSVADGGTKTGGGSDNNNTIKQVTETAPTVAEVSQVTTTDAAAEDTEANKLLKIKKKGRSQSIMTSTKGVTKTSSDYSLGKKSLLGQV